MDKQQSQSISNHDKNDNKKRKKIYLILFFVIGAIIIGYFGYLVFQRNIKYPDVRQCNIESVNSCAGYCDTAPDKTTKCLRWQPISLGGEYRCHCGQDEPTIWFD